jgi:hypothetical protein
LQVVKVTPGGALENDWLSCGITSVKGQAGRVGVDSTNWSNILWNSKQLLDLFPNLQIHKLRNSSQLRITIRHVNRQVGLVELASC